MDYENDNPKQIENQADTTQETQQQIENQADTIQEIQLTSNTPRFKLVVKDKGQATESTYLLESGKEIIVGADSACSIPVNDEYISSRHFSLKVEGNMVEIKDLGSRNGIFLKVDQSAPVMPGQGILAGKTLFRLEEENG